MITSWMLYTLLVGALVSVAAVVVARLAAAAGRPTRGVWAIALLASVALPAFGAVRTILAARATPVVLVPFTITVQSPVSVARANAWWLAPDRALTVLWVVLSALLFARLARGIATLNRSRRTWRDERVDGTEVRLSENVGPAVVGLRSMDVVLPEWILSLDQPLRAIVLRHEEEHRRARDPMLLFGAELLWALMPWNLPLWFQSRRLRLAIEMDCDARVLRAHPSTERYGLLMLTIAQRRSASPLLATALSEPATQLERRFIAMRAARTPPRARDARRRRGRCARRVGVRLRAPVGRTCGAASHGREEREPEPGVLRVSGGRASSAASGHDGAALPRYVARVWS